MNSRRSFFKSLANAAAIVALAPQLAFRTPIKTVTAPEPPKVEGFWYQTERHSFCVSDEYYKALIASGFTAKF